MLRIPPYDRIDEEEDIEMTMSDCDDDDLMDECRQRQEAELEFIASAYNPEEAWWEEVEKKNTDGSEESNRRSVIVHRIIPLTLSSSPLPSSPDEGEDVASSSSPSSLWINLRLTLPHNYPHGKLAVEGSVDGGGKGQTSSSLALRLRKTAMDTLPALMDACNTVLNECLGEESVFPIFNAADEWISNEWPVIFRQAQESTQQRQQAQNSKSLTGTGSQNSLSKPKMNTLGRRLIYSHHIISKKKRADIKNLVSDYNLTGYMKIGWPGLIIIEGHEVHCQQFYDDIRPWKWQYLVVRGEQQEDLVIQGTHDTGNGEGPVIDSLRKFPTFEEVDDMSVVATACREVGLEELFMTSMKQYRSSDNSSDGNSDVGGGGTSSVTVDSTNHDHRGQSMYGILVLVDHMNDGKGYRKWLRRTSGETNVFLLMKQYFPSDDYTKRPTILVGVVGSQPDTSNFMKRWRTSRVDVDSKGKACLERKMKVLAEGDLGKTGEEVTNICSWDDDASTDEHFTTTYSQLDKLLQAIGGTDWAQQIDNENL